MKFRIEQPGEQEKAELIMTLKLEHDGDDVNVVGVTEDDEYFLVSFNSDGTFYKYGSIDPCTGFRLNKNRQIKERK